MSTRHLVDLLTVCGIVLMDEQITRGMTNSEMNLSAPLETTGGVLSAMMIVVQ